MPIHVYGASHVGKVRKNNEDTFWHAKLPSAEHCQFAMVSDGVGGKDYGEIASDTAKQVFQEIVNDNKLAHAVDETTRTAMLDMSARRAHQEIAKLGQQNKDYAGMACTLIAVLADPNCVGWVNVGDSRLYHYSQSSLTQVSADQTIAQTMLNDGRIKKEDLATHPDRNTLLYCLGVEAINQPVAPDSNLLNWQVGDKLLLCSDGLSDMVDSEGIARFLENNPQNATERLIEAALEAGGKDNITVIILENSA